MPCSIASLIRLLALQRYFVLTEDALYYYKKETDHGSVSPSGACARACAACTSDSCCLGACVCRAGTISCADIKMVEAATHGKGSEDGCRLNIELRGAERIFELLAESASQCQEWVRLLSLQASTAAINAAKGGAAAPAVSHE